MITRRMCIAAGVSLLVAPAPMVAQQPPVSLGQEQVVGRAQEMGTIMAAAVAPDGGVYALDYENARIVAFDAEGRHRWTVGRRGRGPGEFRSLYRADVRRDGTLFIYDRGTHEVTAISPDGRIGDRYRMPFPLVQVDNLVALGDQLLVSGTTADPTGTGRGIHRFRLTRPELQYTASFGALPVARDPMVLQHWGAGSIARGSTGSIWYTRRLPYEVYRFDVTGRQRAVIRPPFRARGTPDDAIRIDRGERSTSFSDTGAEVEVPGSAWELPGGLLLVPRTSSRTRNLDVFTVSGRYRGSLPYPTHWDFIAGFDADRRVLWVAGTQADEPVLYRVPVTLSTPSPRRP
ncbi:MAG TPA: hypothetical protein VK358_01385 [Longimicrobium sp.]|nr:hypothetical protein [Longimicrobium sp.]